MDPSLLAGAASGLIQSGVNAIFQSQQNKKNRKFSREMYDLQHQHSIENWHRENEYNSPQAQMRRLSDAGLSPHLVYGKGATATGGSIDSASAHNPNTAAPRLSGFDVLGKYMDFQMRQAQVNNLRTQNTVMLEDAKLRSAQTADTLASAQRKGFDLGLDSELRQYSVDTRKEQLRQLRALIDISQNRDRREQSLHSPTKLNLQLGNRLKQSDLNLRKEGIFPHDPLWMRFIQSHTKNWGDYLKRTDRGWIWNNF